MKQESQSCHRFDYLQEALCRGAGGGAGDCNKTKTKMMLLELEQHGKRVCVCVGERERDGLCECILEPSLGKAC